MGAGPSCSTVAIGLLAVFTSFEVLHIFANQSAKLYWSTKVGFFVLVFACLLQSNDYLKVYFKQKLYLLAEIASAACCYMVETKTEDPLETYHLGG